MSVRSGRTPSRRTRKNPYLARLCAHAKDRRSRIPSDPRGPEDGARCAPPAAECSAGLPVLFLERQTSRRAVVGIAERTLAAVFKKSGVKNAHAHRYRHTLATRLLARVPRSSGRRHPGEHPNGRSKALWQVVKGPAEEHRPADAGALSDGWVTKPVTKKSHKKMGAVN